MAYLDERSEAHAKSGDAQTAAIYDGFARIVEALMHDSAPPAPEDFLRPGATQAGKRP